MKTRDRILDVSLSLFNEEGEAAQTAVDIANALDMSPGNLYYHFKGKEPIIEALFDRFEEEMQIILGGSPSAVTSIEDNWVFVYIVLEEIYDFRFFYRNIGDMMERYPAMASRFRRILAMKRKAINEVLGSLEKRDLVHVDKRLRDHLVKQMVATLTFWLSHDLLEGEQRDGPRLIHDTVLQFMLLVVPYMGEAGYEAMVGMLDRHRELVKS
ncbi:MAG: TetR/AcrR family transcriptional regulator [Henriciella sp.]|nr:TetR/AcrR family transcriptional regulator [Henriciella sp.]